MPHKDDIPRVCYELLSVIHAHGNPIPFRKLPAELRDIGLLKVCSHRGLIEIVLWHESSCGSGGALPAKGKIVVPLPGWVRIYDKGYTSIVQAIERDAKCDDPKRGVHVGSTGRGDIAFEEWKLVSRSGNESTELHEETLEPLPPDQQAVWDLLKGEPLQAKQIAVALGNVVGEDAIRKRIEAIRKTGRQINNRRRLG